MESTSYDYTFHYEIKGVHIFVWRVHWKSESSDCKHTVLTCTKSLGKHGGKERMASKCTRMRQMMLWAIPMCNRKNVCSLKEVAHNFQTKIKGIPHKAMSEKQSIKARLQIVMYCLTKNRLYMSYTIHLFYLWIWPSMSVTLKVSMIFKTRRPEGTFLPVNHTIAPDLVIISSGPVTWEWTWSTALLTNTNFSNQNLIQVPEKANLPRGSSFVSPLITSNNLVNTSHTYTYQPLSTNLQLHAGSSC